MRPRARLTPGSHLRNGSTMGDFLGGPWDLDVFLIVNLALAAALYLAEVRLRRDRTAIPPWPVGRTISFLSGLVLLALVWLEPEA